ncbi:PilW family protein [Planctomicrobium sp. SH527]|uniref:PilW family protein n=1 Tax=Planctomicrobium sp. SH527 TaxID=3448123 RepID=UPI003F5B28DD
MIKSSFHSCRIPQRILQATRLEVRGAALRPAFTLVEMLISTALVMMIMTMFAQIYGTAVNTMSMQRGMANNDQKARTVNNLMLADLRARTYRQTIDAYGSSKGLVPLVLESNQRIDADRQRGYFYYSENDPGDDSDDVLQFTAMLGTSATAGDESTDSSLIFQGKAANIPAANTRQPDNDDGINDGNSQSRAAEISYFIRGGNLYRRVMLLRDPPYSTPPADSQPLDASGVRLFNYPANPNYGVAGTNNFWTDFDYSATRDYNAADDGTYLWFNSTYSLDNTNIGGLEGKPLALPWNRFGHYSNKSTTPLQASHGCPREFVGPTNNEFIGRFTAEETSSDNMGWPGVGDSTTHIVQSNRFNRADPSLTLNNDFAITSLAGGKRISEDLLLSNVEAFNVEYWDDTDVNSNNHGFVSLGAVGGPWGDANNASKNPLYGPVVNSATRRNRVFDTWHHTAFSTDGAGGTNTLPPRFPLNTDSLPAMAAIYDTWTDVPDPNAIVNAGSILRLPGYERDTIYYTAVRSGLKGSVMAPSFPPDPGNIVEEPYVDLNSNGMQDVGEEGVVWQCLDNRIGMKAIRITIRFRDVGKNLPRQLTLVHSFVE